MTPRPGVSRDDASLIRTKAPRDPVGQGLAEYALILALIVIVALIAVVFLGNQVTRVLINTGGPVDKFVRVPIDVRITRSGDRWQIVEHMTISDDVRATIEEANEVPVSLNALREEVLTQDLRQPWQLARLVDSQLVFEQTWFLDHPPGLASQILPADLPVILEGMRAFGVSMLPSPDSVAYVVSPARVVLNTSPAGSLASLDDRDYWTVPFNEHTEGLGLTLAPPWAQNPIGAQVLRAITSDLVPWALFALITVVSAYFVGKLRRSKTEVETETRPANTPRARDRPSRIQRRRDPRVTRKVRTPPPSGS